jgi:hypothetical protein
MARTGPFAESALRESGRRRREGVCETGSGLNKEAET